MSLTWERLTADFHWLCNSAGLLQTEPDAPEFNAWLATMRTECNPLWLALQQHDPALSSLLSQASTKRLGHYYAHLWQALLQYHLRYQCVLANQVIYEGTRTLGELDLIVWDKHLAQWEHWELAVKFYLGVGAQTTQLTAWLGPNLHDCLQHKWHRLLTHQLPLSQHPITRSQLAPQVGPIAVRRLILQGRLFYPLAQAISPPHLVDVEHAQGFWCTPARFQQYFAALPLRWVVLPKAYWLAPITLDTCALPTLGATELMATHAQHTRPVAVAGLAQGREQVRGFLVSAAWLEQAQKLR